MNKIWAGVPGVKYPDEPSTVDAGPDFATSEELSTAQAAEVLGLCKTTAIKAMRAGGIVPRELRGHGHIQPLAWPRSAVYRMASRQRVDELPAGYATLEEALQIAGVGKVTLYRWHDAGAVRTVTSEKGFKLPERGLGTPARIAWHVGDLKAKRAELARKALLKAALLAGSTLGVQREGGEV